MKRLFALAEEYMDGCDWKLLAIFKICLLTLGMLIGMYAPRRYRRSLTLTCVPLFLVTYLPLMERLARVWRESGEQPEPQDPAAL